MRTLRKCSVRNFGSPCTTSGSSFAVARGREHRSPTGEVASWILPRGSQIRFLDRHASWRKASPFSWSIDMFITPRQVCSMGSTM
jgi:hypothetical protein